MTLKCAPLLPASQPRTTSSFSQQEFNHDIHPARIRSMQGLLVPWDTGEGFSEKKQWTPTLKWLQLRKKRYCDGSNGYNLSHAWGNKRPVDKSWFNHGQKMIFWPKQPFPPEFLQVHLWPPDSLPPKRPVLSARTIIIDYENFHLLRRSIVQNALTEQSKGLLSNSPDLLLLCLIIFATNHYFLLLATVKPRGLI